MRLTSTPEQRQAAFEATVGDPAWSASRHLISLGQSPSEMFQVLAIRPDLLAAMSGLGEAVYPGGLLERPLKERVVLEVSRLNECQYCKASHTGTMQRLGIAIAPPEGQTQMEMLTERERLALAYTRAALADSNRVPDTLFANLQQAFSEGEIVELTFLVGLTGLLNLFNNCLQVRYHDDYAFEGLVEPV
jgi:AhpD family alkylhydroperoxidase